MYMCSKEVKKMKAFFKKINALLMSVILISSMPTALAEQEEVYFYDDFNSYATNETETSIAVENTAAYVKEYEKSDKALEVNAGVSKGKLTVNWDGQADNVVMAFDIRCEEAKSAITLLAANSSGKESTLLNMTPDGEIQTYDEKIIGGFSEGRTVKLAVAVDNINEQYNVYVNGKSILYGWNMKDSVIPSKMIIMISGGEKFDVPVYVDNIRVYSGRNINKKFSKTKCNPDSIELISQPARVSAAVITENAFDLSEGDAPKNINELSVNYKSNVAEIISEGENRYLRIEQITTNDFHIDTNFTNDLNYLVVQSDFKFEKFGSMIYPFILRDNVSNSSSADETFGTIDRNGVLKLSNGKKAYTFNIGEWYNIAVAINLQKLAINVYVNNELIEENMPVANKSFYKPRMVRTWCYGMEGAALDFDNYYIYEATEPVSDISEFKNKMVSVMSDGLRETAMLDGKTAMCISNGLVYKDGEKKYTEVPQEKDGDYYVSSDTARILLGDINVNTDTVPLKAEAKKKGMYVYEDKDKYLLIFSDNKFKADNALLEDVSRYMKMLLPDAERIKSDFKAKNEAHPRILATAEDWEKIKLNVRNYADFGQWHKKIMAQADSKLDTAVEYYHYEIQENILHPARRFKEKMLYWGYAWQMTGDRKYVDRAWEEMKSVCKFPDWSPVHPLDTGELLFGSAIGYDWMYDALTPEQRKVIEEGTLRLGIEVLRSAYYGRLRTEQRFGSLSGGNFVMSPTNFNVVVNGGLTAAALAYADIYPDECFDAISKAIQSLGYMLPCFEPSGGWEEGPNYWNYTTAYLANMVSALDSACGTDYGIMKHPGVSLTPYYAIYLDSYQGLNNFSDTSRGWSWDSPQFSCFGKTMNEPAFTYQRYASLTGRNQNAMPTVFDMIWLDITQSDAKPELPLDNLTPGIEMVSMREDWEMSDAMNFGAHGGDNTAYHGHYDGGTWIFDILGERWAIDLGMDEKSYVGNSMDILYRTRTEGHNMLVFNPSQDSGFKRESYTSVLRYETAPKGGIIVYDNSEGYAPWTSKVIRGFYVGDERRSLTVRDEFTVKSKDTEVYWNMQTPADIEIDGNNAILTINGKKLLVEFATDAEEFEILSLKAEPLPGSVNNDIMTKDPDINKLALRAKVSGSCYIEAKLSALGEPASKSGMLNKPVSEWTLPEGELIRRGDSKLSSISSNGNELSEFKPNKTTYTLAVLEGQQLPVIEAESENGSYEINQATSTDEVTTITSYDSSGLYSTTYVIKYMLLKAPADVLGMTRNIVYDLRVSSTPEEANVGPNMLDGDLNTRWAGQGVGEWAVFDLGSVKPIDAIGIAYEWGDERKYTFSVEISDDGDYYRQIYSGASSGTTEEIELVKLAERVNARYVRLVGGGNTVNTWNGVREFAILTEKGEK